MLLCKHKGKKRQLKSAQMNIVLFDDSGTKPITSWLYEKIEGWEYDEKKKTLTLKSIEAGSTELLEFKMTWPEDAKYALDTIKVNVESLLSEKKRLRKQEKAKRTSGDELQERINKALNNNCKDVRVISQVLDDARAARHIHPSVVSLQAKLKTMKTTPWSFLRPTKALAHSRTH